MKWRDLRNRGGSDLDIKMTPMIDVVFLLLIYFLWTASFNIAEFDLPTQLMMQMGSEAVDISEPPPPEADFSDIVVRLQQLDNKLIWSINDVPYQSTTGVRDQLRTLVEINPAANVIVYPDPEIPLGDVIDVYDIARSVGFDGVSFAATPEAS